jgi:hypothetical protein
MSMSRGVSLLLSSLIFGGCLLAQSTGAIQGSVFDASGAAIPSADVTIHSDANGTDRSLSTDAAGSYFVPSLAVGSYRVQVKAAGMAQMAASNVVVSVGTTTQQNFTMKVASASEIVEIEAAPPTVETAAVSIGTVVNQKTVQEIR